MKKINDYDRKTILNLNIMLGNFNENRLLDKKLNDLEKDYSLHLKIKKHTLNNKKNIKSKSTGVNIEKHDITRSPFKKSNSLSIDKVSSDKNSNKSLSKKNTKFKDTKEFDINNNSIEKVNISKFEKDKKVSQTKNVNIVY